MNSSWRRAIRIGVAIALALGVGSAAVVPPAVATAASPTSPSPTTLSAQQNPKPPAAGTCPTPSGQLVTNACAVSNKLTPEPSKAAYDIDSSKGACFASGNKLRRCVFGKSSHPALKVALVGDSHAQQYLPVFRALAAKNGWELFAYFHGSCAWRAQAAPGSGAVVQGNGCPTWNVRAQAALTRDAPDLIVTSAYAHDQYVKVAPDDFAATQAAAALDFEAAWKVQIDRGARVLAIGDGPRWDTPPSKCLESKTVTTWHLCAEALAAAFPYPDPLRVAATESSTTFVDLTEQFCPGGVCPAEIGHVTIYRDLHHLTATFVRTQASALQNAVEKAMS